MDAYTWTDADGDTARLLAYNDYGGLDDDDSALLCGVNEEREEAEAWVCIDTREQAEGIIAWLRGFFGIEP